MPLPERCTTDRGRDLTEALCACAECGTWFADHDAFRHHRPRGVCMPPAEVGLTLIRHPHRCWRRPKGKR